MRLFIEEIYKFYENPKNLADFQEWKASKGKDMRNDEIDLCIEGGSVPDGYRYDRVN